MTEPSAVRAPTRTPPRAMLTRERISELELRLATLERERSAWEQERAAWVLAATARPLELVLTLPSIAAGFRGLARRAATAAFSALRGRLPI